MPEVMRCVLLCMLGAVEGTLCLMEVSEVSEVLQVLQVSEVIRCVLLCTLEAVDGGSVCGRYWR